MTTAAPNAKRGCACSAEHYPDVKALRDVSPWPNFAAQKARLPPVVARRCRFIIEENQRVLDLAAALGGRRSGRNRHADGRLLRRRAGPL